MTVTIAPATVRRRPAFTWITIAILGFLGLSAAAGGLALAGGAAAPPEEWLQDIPLVRSWLMPGLVLGIGFGAGSLITAYGIWRKPSWGWLSWAERITGHHWSWAATLFIGSGHLIWIILELVYLPELSFLQLVYGMVAVSLIVLPLLPSVRADLVTGKR